MGLYKLCNHKGRMRDRCEHAWWGSFQWRGRLRRESLTKWSGRETKTKQDALATFDRMKDAIRSGTFDTESLGANMTFDAFADVYLQRYVALRKLRSASTVKVRLGVLRERFGSTLLTNIFVT